MSSTSNKHVWDYLNYYIGLIYPPGFAVLVSGRWGVGKTYLLKRFLKVTFEEDAVRWSRFLRQAVKVDLLMQRMIHHEDTQTVHG